MHKAYIKDETAYRNLLTKLRDQYEGPVDEGLNDEFAADEVPPTHYPLFIIYEIERSRIEELPYLVTLYIYETDFVK